MDISSSSVKLVELAEAAKGNPRVERYAIEALPKDAVLDGNITNLDAVVDAVQRGWKRMGTRTKKRGHGLAYRGGDHQEDHRPRGTA